MERRFNSFITQSTQLLHRNEAGPDHPFGLKAGGQFSDRQICRFPVGYIVSPLEAQPQPNAVVKAVLTC